MMMLKPIVSLALAMLCFCKSGTYYTETGVSALAWKLKDEKLAVGTEDGKIQILTTTKDDLKSMQAFGRQGDKVTCIAWSPDGKSLVSGSPDGKVILWERKKVDVKEGLEIEEQEKEIQKHENFMKYA